MKIYGYFLTITIFFFINNIVKAQVAEDTVWIVSAGDTLEGSLIIPENNIDKKIPVVLLIAGSGPTNRDGNQGSMMPNTLKLIAYQLADFGVASLRYDKRGIGESKINDLREKNLRFDDFITDAVNWIYFLKKNRRFGSITVIGHSQGSLIGMVAAQRANADKFISLAGAGLTIDTILLAQLKEKSDDLYYKALPIVMKLRKGETTDEVPMELASVFRPDIQPYLISWIKYDPAEEIKKLTIPILIIQGTTDLQVSTQNAEILNHANEKSKLLIIENMNHVLKEATNDKQQNYMTYFFADIPLKKGLVEAITDFVKNNKTE